MIKVADKEIDGGLCHEAAVLKHSPRESWTRSARDGPLELDWYGGSRDIDPRAAHDLTLRQPMLSPSIIWEY